MELLVIGMQMSDFISLSIQLLSKHGNLLLLIIHNFSSLSHGLELLLQALILDGDFIDSLLILIDGRNMSGVDNLGLSLVDGGL